MPARNEIQARMMYRPALQVVCNYVAQKVWNENREVVRQVVYEAHHPYGDIGSSTYVRTYEFLEAWEVTNVNQNAGSKDGYAKFYYKPNNITTVGSSEVDAYGDPPYDYGQHIGVAGSYKGKGSREYLADIIYQGVSSGAYGGGKSSYPARNAYKELIRRIGKQKIRSWFTEGFKAAGLKAKYRGGGIKVTYTDD